MIVESKICPAADNVVEFGPIALSRLSQAHRRESDERRRLEQVARANYAAQAQTHAVVIDLLEAAGPEDLAQRLDDLARLRFGLALGVLALEGPGAPPEGWRSLLEGQTRAIVGAHRLARLGPAPLAAGLFGALAPQVGSAALIRLQVGDRAGLLAFGAFDEAAFAPDMGAELVIFIARVIERIAERWLRA